MRNNDLTTEIALNNDRVNFRAYAGTNNPISVDDNPPIGDGKGYTSLE